MNLKSINYWSMPGGLEGTLDVFEFMRLAKHHRFDAVEIAIGEPGTAFGLGADEALCNRVLDEANKIGISVASTASGLYWARSVADSNSAIRGQASEDLVRMLQIASWLKVETHLTIPGAVDVFFLPERDAQSYDEVYQLATDGIRFALPAAEKFGVRMGIENVWNKFLTSPLEMKSFIDQFESRFVGAYVDVGNILPYGYPQQWLRILGERVVGVHFKDFRLAVGNANGFVDLLEGDVNWPDVITAIKEIGYSGPLVAEMIPGYKHFPMVRIANTSNAMDAIMGR